MKTYAIALLVAVMCSATDAHALATTVKLFFEEVGYDKLSQPLLYKFIGNGIYNIKFK
ncbi:MAG: hypothetical protein Q4A54_00495 [Parabacteroides sp.]|nr:hypothetical protein [Parabacteroides sp.]